MIKLTIDNWHHLFGPFTPTQRAEATFYVASHYRVHLADSYGIILPDLEQSK